MSAPVLQYSCDNEDTRSELDALQVEGRRVASICAAGGRALSLLLGDPREVVAIDRNPAQIYLGQLAAAGIRRLERGAYLTFVGLTEGADRASTYAALRLTLPDAARGYWDARPEEIASGVLHVGRCERGIARVAPLFRTFLGRAVARLRESRSLDEQAALARALLHSPQVRLLFALIFNPLSGRFVLRDAVYYGDNRRLASRYLEQRLLETMQHHRFDDCFVLSLFWNGHLKGSQALPEYLTEGGYERVRARLDRLRFVEADIVDWLEREPDASVDAFSLSDLGGYLTSERFSVMLAQVQRVASTGARVCIREYISEPTRAARWPVTLRRDAALEQRLLRTDRSVGCTFVCAEQRPA